MQAIVAVSQSWGIGRDGQLLFRLRADLQRFKALTTGHTVVMGRKTLETLPGGRGLPDRRNLVLTRQESLTPDRAETVHSPEELLALADSDAFVIGGQEVYTICRVPARIKAEGFSAVQGTKQTLRPFLFLSFCCTSLILSGGNT